MEPNRSDSRVPPLARPSPGAEGALVLDTERSGEGPGKGCENPRRFLRFLHADGTLTPVRCHSPNKCRYCSWLTARENAVVVFMDASDDLPEIGFTLTTKEAATAPADFRESVAQAFRALRKAYPDAEYLGQIEFTTGTGKNSGGHRRIHQHGLLKGVPRSAADDVAERLLAVWLKRTGAHRVEAHALVKPAGAIAYLVNHHQKSAQTPPKGWSGKRFRPSRGYFASPLGDLRNEARWALTEEAVAWAADQALQDAGAWEALGPSAEYEDILQAAIARRRQLPKPELVRVANLPATWNEDGTPATFKLEVVGSMA